MTFGQLMLNVRRRSQDLRTINGQLITDNNTDGIRWGVADIVNACNGAFDEVARLLTIYDASPIARQLLTNNLIAYKDLTFSSSKASIDNSVLAIISLDKVGTDQTYFGVTPSEFNLKKNSISSNNTESFWFTLVRNADTFAKECLITSAETSLRAILLLDTPELTSSELDLAKEIPFQGIDDFIECIAEKKLRTQEGNFERVAQLLTEIQIYLGVKVDGKT